MYVHILNFLGNMPRNTFFHGYIIIYASSPLLLYRLSSIFMHYKSHSSHFLVCKSLFKYLFP